MVHLAMWETSEDDRPDANWHDKVTDEIYHGSRTRG